MVRKKPKKFSKDWFANLICITAEKADLLDMEEDDEEDEWVEKNEEAEGNVAEKENEEVKEGREESNGLEKEILKEVESIYEPVGKKQEEVQEEIVEEKVEVIKKSPTPDPLRTLAAQLQGQLNAYKGDLNQFSTLMDEFNPANEVPPEEVKETVKEESPKKPLRVERKLSTEEEIAMVRKMSNEDAWSHVMTQVFEVCSFNVLLIAT